MKPFAITKRLNTFNYKNQTMKQEENQDQKLSEKELKQRALLEPILALKHENFKVPEGMVIPLKTQVWIKKYHGNESLKTTNTGIILPDTATNTIIPAIGLIIAVGPECSDFIFPGLDVVFQDLPYMEIMVNGVTYLRLYEDEILGVLPPRTYVYQGVYSDAYMRRMNRLKQFEHYYEASAKRADNAKDESEDKFKKTIRRQPTGKK